MMMETFASFPGLIVDEIHQKGQETFVRCANAQVRVQICPHPDSQWKKDTNLGLRVFECPEDIVHCASPWLDELLNSVVPEDTNGSVLCYSAGRYPYEQQIHREQRSNHDVRLSSGGLLSHFQFAKATDPVCIKWRQKLESNPNKVWILVFDW
jgi:hypothetical protein